VVVVVVVVVVAVVKLVVVTVVDTRIPHSVTPLHTQLIFIIYRMFTGALELTEINYVDNLMKFLDASKANGWKVGIDIDIYIYIYMSMSMARPSYVFHMCPHMHCFECMNLM
jgi:hypothetical protein